MTSLFFNIMLRNMWLKILAEQSNMKLYVCSAGMELFILKITDERGNFGKRSAKIRMCLVAYDSNIKFRF